MSSVVVVISTLRIKIQIQMKSHYNYRYTKVPFWPGQIQNLPSQNGILIWTKDSLGRSRICLDQNRIPFWPRQILDSLNSILDYNIYRMGVLRVQLLQHVLTNLFVNFLHGLKICIWFGYNHQIFFFTLSLSYILDLVMFGDL